MPIRDIGDELPEPKRLEKPTPFRQGNAGGGQRRYDEMSWLTYKHGVLNPMARVSKMIDECMSDIQTLCEHGPFVRTLADGAKIEISYEKPTKKG